MNRNKSIQGLRGIGALTVFVWHVHWFVDAFFKIDLTFFFRGDFANPMFFMLAGFFVGVKEYYKNINTKHFVLKKLRKMYPIYFGTLIIMFMYMFHDCYSTGEGGLKQFIVLIPHIMLLQSWIPKYPYEMYLNGPAWFLSVMCFLWIMTKPALKIIENMNYKMRCIISGLLLCIFVFGVYIIDRYDLTTIIPEIIRPYNFVPYLLGMILGDAIKKENSFFANIVENINNKKIIEIVIGTYFILLLLIRHYFIRVYSFTFLLPLLMLTITFLYKDTSNGIIGKFLEKDFWVELGNISMQFYLLHMPIVEFMKRLSHKMSSYIGGMEIALLSFLITYLIAKVTVKRQFGKL